MTSRYPSGIKPDEVERGKVARTRRTVAGAHGRRESAGGRCYLKSDRAAQGALADRPHRQRAGRDGNPASATRDLLLENQGAQSPVRFARRSRCRAQPKMFGRSSGQARHARGTAAAMPVVQRILPAMQPNGDIAGSSTLHDFSTASGAAVVLKIYYGGIWECGMWLQFLFVINIISYI